MCSRHQHARARGARRASCRPSAGREERALPNLKFGVVCCCKHPAFGASTRAYIARTRCFGRECGFETCMEKTKKNRMPCVPGTSTQEREVPGARRVDRAPAGRNVPCPILNLGLFVAASILLSVHRLEPISHAQDVSAASAALKLAWKKQKRTGCLVFQAPARKSARCQARVV